jgi:hypothetical protein
LPRRCSKINVAFRSAKGRSFAERKATIRTSDFGPALPYRTAWTEAAKKCRLKWRLGN